jgi:hypothetical protein
MFRASSQAGLSLALLHCRWLIMAEQLQMDEFQQAALAALRTPRKPLFRYQIQTNLLDADLAQLSVATLITVLRVTHAQCQVCLPACTCGDIYGFSSVCGCGSGKRQCKRCNRFK